jgi:hypothetical protein
VLPSLSQISVPLDRVAVWSKSFDLASKVMASLSLTATASFATAAYYAPTISIRNSMIASSALAISALPFTLIVILPTVKKLKAIQANNDTFQATAEGDSLIEKWGKLSLIRWTFMLVACLNGLKELSEWHSL